MSSYICFNPKCAHHIDIPDSMEDYPSIQIQAEEPTYKSLLTIDSFMEQQVMVNDGTKVLHRYKHQTEYGDVVYFCESCHGALKFWFDLSAWNSSHGKKY